MAPPFVRTSCIPVAFVALFGCRSQATAPDGPAVAWREWGEPAFAAAREQHRLVLLDLGAEWCHWCHVMEATTYGDPGVRDVIARRYVPIAADADRRLDLAARYQDQGWPATIVFDERGRELWKNRGFVPPERMRTVLQRLADDPSPLGTNDAAAAAATPATALRADTRTALEERMAASYDEQHGGFGDVHKYLDDDAAEWLLERARAGDAVAKARLLRLLDEERALHDPVWGGAYQYSHGGVWTNPHFEKVMSRQLADLRAYSLAHGAFGRAADLEAARGVARFVTTMLGAPDGAFYASQDADLVQGEHAAGYFARDDAGRRALGMPRIERSLWSRENGQAIRGLCALLAVDRDEALLQRVRTAATWIVDHRRRDDGTFAHGDDDRGGPFLADSLEMAAALAALGEVTADARWRELATATIAAIEARFATANGYASAVGDGLLPPVVDRTENVQLARLADTLAHATAEPACARVAEHAFGFAAADAIALSPGLPAGLLLAAAERDREPLHVLVVGAAGDPARGALFAAALRHAPARRIVELLTPGAATAGGDRAPSVASAAAFVCADGACSPPITSVTALITRVTTP